MALAAGETHRTGPQFSRLFRLVCDEVCAEPRTYITQFTHLCNLTSLPDQAARYFGNVALTFLAKPLSPNNQAELEQIVGYIAQQLQSNAVLISRQCSNYERLYTGLVL